MHIGLLLILLPHCCQFPFHVSNQDHHRDYRGDPKVPAWGRKSVQSAESLQAQVMVFSATSSAAPGAAPCVTNPCATHARLQAVPGLHMGLLHRVLPLGSVLGPGASSQPKLTLLKPRLLEILRQSALDIELEQLRSEVSQRPGEANQASALGARHQAALQQQLELCSSACRRACWGPQINLNLSNFHWPSKLFCPTGEADPDRSEWTIPAKVGDVEGSGWAAPADSALPQCLL
ncbi:TPA: hypothetical protein ACH3X3_009895 [Trebouxia sp. C0006]